MPRLACWSCGRSLYTVSPLESLFAEERRCPRCGAFLQNERRAAERRTGSRRVSLAAKRDAPGGGGEERRGGDRRQRQRRQTSDSPASRDRVTAEGRARS